MTYEELKNTNDIKVKDWFQCDVSYPFSAYDDWRTNFGIVRETEKAVLINIGIYLTSGEWDGTRNVWVPKSCFESAKEYEKAQEQLEEKRQQNYEDGCKKYEKLIAFCKENNVKGARNGMRKDTLLKKVQEAGLSYAW